MSFVVSARKYRPVQFDDVVGQQHVTQTLKNAIRNNHLAHAFLFCGPRGVGKTTCARILAKVLNCDRPTSDIEPCGECDSCKSFEKNASLNITELDAASNNSVEHIRSLIEQVRFAPQRGSFKIYIIDEVHMLSNQAFNAFLKTLEEPPSYAKFILATTEKHKIIPTILSRCQIFDFHRIQIADMSNHLRRICEQEGITADEDALHIIAQKADGGLRDALSIYDRVVSFAGNHISYNAVIDIMNVLDYDYYFKIIDAILMEDMASVLNVFDQVLRKGFEGDIFLNGLAEHTRNILVAQDTETLSLLEVSGNLRERYYMQASISPKDILLSVLNICNDADINYKMARNKRLHIEMALMKMCYLRRLITNSKLASTVSTTSGEKKNEPIKSVNTTAEKEGNYEKNLSLEEKKKRLGIAMPTLTIEKVKIAVEEEGKKEIEEALLLDIDKIQSIWKEYESGLNSFITKNILRNASLSLKDEQLFITVGDITEKAAITTEIKLFEILATTFRRRHIFPEFIIDETKKIILENQPKTVNTPLYKNPREKFSAMAEINPLIKDLQKRFKLDLDKK